MAAWRRAIELSLGEADTAKLRSIAQSRTEPASRVERARILLAYREDHPGCVAPSEFAQDRRACSRETATCRLTSPEIPCFKTETGRFSKNNREAIEQEQAITESDQGLR